ncbi:lipid II flippase MurJ [Micromonospora chokoriensis]|uniref:lipid II flippase MurJ n=1 Tax=Micromonospora chokoriensis TaxID=356851 RepID=UPI0004C2B4CB|nr:lipid II flippase MurJ [Micromonospora chokoriensis]
MGKVFFRLVLGGIAGKILGVLREVLLAALFGAGRVVAANRIALTATLIPINFFTADALSAGFLPLYVQYRQERPTMAQALYRAVHLLLAVFSVVLAVALILGRDLWVGLLGPGLDPQTADIAATMLGIAALGVPFYVLYNLYTLVGLANDDVRLINLRPSCQSIGLILATVIAWMTGQVSVLAWGFTLPYIVLWCLGAHWLRRQGYLREGDETGPHRPDRAAAKLALQMFWRRLRPLLLIPVILQGSIGVERAVGSLLGVEVVAATEYARFVVDSCMALLAAPLGLAGLASFARMKAHEVGDGLRRLIPPVILVAIPLALILSLNSRGIVTLLYARGEFDERAVDVSSVLLLGFALGIWAHVLGYTFVKVLNARGANFKVAIVMAVSFGVPIAVNLLLYKQWGAFTIGAASSVGGLLMFLISARLLSVLGFSMRLLTIALPGAAAAAAAGYLLAGPGLLRLAASCVAILLIWVGYVAVVPQLRRTFLSFVLKKLGRGVDETPQADLAEIK